MASELLAESRGVQSKLQKAQRRAVESKGAAIHPHVWLLGAESAVDLSEDRAHAAGTNKYGLRVQVTAI